MKQYAVEVYSTGHGKHGATHYFGMILSHTSKEGAKDFATEIVENMTRKEFNEMCFDDVAKPFQYENELNEKVGIYISCFRFRVSKFEG